MYRFTIKCTDILLNKILVSIVADSYSDMMTKFNTMSNNSLTFKSLLNVVEMALIEDEETSSESTNNESEGTE